MIRFHLDILITKPMDHYFNKSTKDQKFLKDKYPLKIFYPCCIIFRSKDNGVNQFEDQI